MYLIGGKVFLVVRKRLLCVRAKKIHFLKIRDIFVIIYIAYIYPPKTKNTLADKAHPKFFTIRSFGV